MQVALEQKLNENKDNPTVSACELQSCINLIEYCRKRIGTIMADKLRGNENATTSDNVGSSGP